MAHTLHHLISNASTWAGGSPRAKTAFWATSASVSWESRDSASMAPSVGLLTFSSASARGIALLHIEAMVLSQVGLVD